MSVADKAPASGRTRSTRGPQARADDPHAWKGSEDAALRTLELVFFVHMQMADAADQMLAEHGLGRPHHRVLYFAGRQPGITVGELMTLLRISNQALARTTNLLTAEGLLEQRYSPSDRRVRQNFITPKAQALLKLTTQRQLGTIAAALEHLTPSQVEGMWSGLQVMVRPEDMAWITEHPAPPPGTT